MLASRADSGGWDFRSLSLLHTFPVPRGPQTSSVGPLKSCAAFKLINPPPILQLYGLYKQATTGDNDTDKPGLFDMKVSLLPIAPPLFLVNIAHHHTTSTHLRNSSLLTILTGQGQVECLDGLQGNIPRWSWEAIHCLCRGAKGQARVLSWWCLLWMGHGGDKQIVCWREMYISVWLSTSLHIDWECKELLYWQELIL